MESDASKRVADQIVRSLDGILYSPLLVARRLSRVRGPIQRNLWIIVKALIKFWAIDGKHRQYDYSNKDIHDWAERIDNGND